MSQIDWAKVGQGQQYKTPLEAHDASCGGTFKDNLEGKHGTPGMTSADALPLQAEKSPFSLGGLGSANGK